MFFVYVLLSERDGKFYIGQTNDLSDRMKRHNAGRVPATRYRIPFRLVHSEVFASRSVAVTRERYLKSLKGSKKFHEIVGMWQVVRHPAKGGTFPGSNPGTPA